MPKITCVPNWEQRQPLNADDILHMLDRCSLVPEPLRLQCIIALCWLFGKRIREVMQLRLGDVSVSGHAHDKMLRVQFYVLKKGSRYEPLKGMPYKHEITCQNIFVKYVAKYMSQRIKEATKLFQEGNITNIDNEYLFPSPKPVHNVKHTVKHRFRNVEGKLVKDKNGEIEKVYTYQYNNAHLSPERARQMLKIVAHDVWFHWIRHSLATQFADDGATEDDLMKLFDWDDVRMPHEYVKHSVHYSKFANRRR